LRFGPFLLPLVALTVSFGIIYNAYGSIAFFISDFLMSVCYSLRVRPTADLSAATTQLARLFITKLPVFVTFLGGVSVVAHLSVFSICANYHASIIGWPPVRYVYVIGHLLVSGLCGRAACVPDLHPGHCTDLLPWLVHRARHFSQLFEMSHPRYSRNCVIRPVLLPNPSPVLLVAEGYAMGT
jgi:hypothetical protein